MGERNIFLFDICVCVLIGRLMMDGEIAGFSCLGLAHGPAVMKFLF